MPAEGLEILVPTTSGKVQGLVGQSLCQALRILGVTGMARIKLAWEVCRETEAALRLI